MRFGVWALCVIGCGRVGFDSGNTDATAHDTPADADTSCWPLWRGDVQLTAPTRVTEVNDGANDKNPFVTDDGLTMYFSSDRAPTVGGLDFWRATRASTSEPFVVADSVSELNGAGDEGRLVLDRSELVAVFSAVRTGGEGGNDVYIATRPDKASPFAIDTAAMAVVNTPGGEKDPHFVDGNIDRVYMSSDVNLAVVRRNGTIYGAPELISVTVPGSTGYADPQGSPDELTIVFSANNVATVNDFYVATRSTPSEPYGVPRALTALNTVSLERDLTISNDGCELWFSRNIGGDEIWTSHVIR